MLRQLHTDSAPETLALETETTTGTFSLADLFAAEATGTPVRPTTPGPTVPKTPTIPTGAFEIEPDGTILSFRPYDEREAPRRAYIGKNLFEDVVRSASIRDADYFANAVVRGETYRASRHMLNGRDLSLILFFHADTDTYWGFLGPV